MIRLFVNVDHVATVREARKTTEPDPLEAALIAERSGAEGITVHLREDRRHIQDHDVQRIHASIRMPLNLEMAPVDEMTELAARIIPYQVSLVPEKRLEITTEGGLNVLENEERLIAIRKRLSPLGIKFSLFVDADREQIEASRRVQADSIELNTGPYSEATSREEIARALSSLQSAAEFAGEQGLKVFAGHGLTNANVAAIASIPQVEELNIGHNLVARAISVGMEQAVRDMLVNIREGERLR
ncbi:MAG: pyridoxine 5'-phosphate synthase [Candidatus Nitrohelix vancouverensis]|uniref:Pyridoxine 5'-phosphate synthase n=1 Tax=Candidatus Nitrohelix vancouverensis TaxID=2705534 RepID=A0A7T0G441_9BACT|nr:MAG: pyridoxine 5'-phosphate synthase [Candidatus Nitrohelix vancouverensis]